MGMISKKAGGACALGLALGAAIMMAQAASAAVEVEYDFADLADADGETFWDLKTGTASALAGGGSFSGSPGVTTWTKVVGTGSLGVTASGYNDGTPGTSRAYLDKDGDTTNGKRAGLGVCAAASTSNASQCAPSNDDNVGQIGGTGGSGIETLVLDFSGLVSKLRVEFAAEGHVAFAGSLKSRIDGSGSDAFTDLTTGQFYDFAMGKRFEFRYAGDVCTTPTSGDPVCDKKVNQFYISSAVATVPLPAGVLLLGSALGGLGLMKRRRKAA